MLRKKNTFDAKSDIIIGCYQPLSISEAIGRPEPGIPGVLSLELDENAWKI